MKAIETKARSSYVLALLATAAILSACGSGSVEPPSSAQDVLERMSEAMASVESLAFTGERTFIRTEEGQRSVTTVAVDGLYGANDSYFVREDYDWVDDPPRIGGGLLKGQVEWVAADGVVLSRNATGGDGLWREFASSFSGRPPSAPSWEFPGVLSINDWQDDFNLDGILVHHFRAERPYGDTGAIQSLRLFVAQDSYRLVRLMMTVDLDSLSEEKTRIVHRHWGPSFLRLRRTRGDHAPRRVRASAVCNRYVRI